MKSFFESNLLLLSAYDPALADFLRSYSSTGKTEVFDTPSGVPSIRVKLNGKEQLLHSSRDPVREAQRWVETLRLPQMHNLIVLGAGLMHHVFQLVLRHNRGLKNLYIIESDAEILYQAFHWSDLSAFLQTKTTFFLCSPDGSSLRAFMNRHLTPLTLDGVTVVEHPASVGMNEPYYQDVRRLIDESLQGGEILLRTKVQLGGLIQRNLIRNVPALLNNPTASALNGLFRETPAFVVCAGPSLDWNIGQLYKVKDQGVVIAVDTVYKKLLANDVVPHIVVSTDPTELNLRHFEGVMDLGETTMVFSPSVNPGILVQMTGTRVSLPLPASKFLNAFRNIFGDLSYMAVGTNVGQTCFNLAKYLGCGPIVLAGLDLSFPAGGGYSHCSDTALRRKIKRSETPGKMMVELINDSRPWEEFDPILIPGNEEEQVATSKFWLAYLRSFEEEVRKTQVRVINCTEGGARIEGAETARLADVIEELCVKDRMVHSTLQMSVGFFFSSNTKEGAALVEEAKAIVDFALEKAEEGLAQLQRLETVVQSASPDPLLISEQVNALTKIHIELIQEQKIYAVLDEAADRVLHPFLKQENRPQGEELTDTNIHKVITRYSDYFSGMRELCNEFSTILHETVEQTKTQDDLFGSFEL